MGGLEVTLRSRFPFENSDSEGKFAGVGNYLKKELLEKIMKSRERGKEATEKRRNIDV